MKITEDQVSWTLTVDCDDIPIRGNVMASGDAEFDKQVEDALISRVNSGDVWAWARVEVTGTFKGLSESEYLGGCSYKDQNDFEESGYYDDMKAVILATLNST